MSGEPAVYFVSDAHLGARIPTCQDRERHLISFLGEIAPTARSLFVLGDLFDFWVEYRHAIRPDYFPVLHALRSLVEKGTAVHYVAGNHDFALGKFLTGTIGMRIYPDHFEGTIDGTKAFLFHGDGLAKIDVGYRMLRRILRNPINQRLYRLLHPNIGVPLASLFSGSSRRLLAPRLREHIIAEYREHARKRLDAGADLVVFGHTHRPEIYSSEGKTYCNTGQWIREYNYAKLQDGVMTLWQYLPGAPHQRIAPAAWKQGSSAS